MLSWLLLAVLGMIWAAFLLPSWRRSPTSTVEEFEDKMNVLAETNKVTSGAGRWVLMPRQGRRFLGPEDRQRARMVRRRRVVFITMLEVMGLTTLMGLFPPLRPMLYATGVLAILLVGYVVLLLKIRSDEVAEGRYRRARAAAVATASHRSKDGFRDGNGFGRPYGTDDGYAYGNGVENGVENGNGNGVGFGEEVFDHRSLLEGGVQIIDEDVHVVVRRSDEVDVQALRAGDGSTG